MVWTESHDILLCREILVKNPFTYKKSSPQRGQIWQEIATNLSHIREPNFKVDLDQRAVRERYKLLSNKLRRKLNDEMKASGIDTDMSEVEDMVEELIELEDASLEQQRLHQVEQQKKVEEDKENSNDMRVKAMESLGETKRRKGDEEKKGKKRRSNGSETLQYLREKNELMAKFRIEDKVLEERKLKEESTRHDEFMKMMLQQQQQFQAIIAQQQQQQNQLMMAVISKLGSK